MHEAFKVNRDNKLFLVKIGNGKFTIIIKDFSKDPSLVFCWEVPAFPYHLHTALNVVQNTPDKKKAFFAEALVIQGDIKSFADRPLFALAIRRDTDESDTVFNLRDTEIEALRDLLYEYWTC